MNSAFPVYLKYKNHKTWFRIINSGEFEELRVLGSFFNLRKYKVSTLPDRNFLADLLYDQENRTEIITSHEFDEQLEFCYRNLKEKNF